MILNTTKFGTKKKETKEPGRTLIFEGHYHLILSRIPFIGPILLERYKFFIFLLDNLSLPRLLSVLCRATLSKTSYTLVGTFFIGSPKFFEIQAVSYFLKITGLNLYLQWLPLSNEYVNLVLKLGICALPYAYVFQLRTDFIKQYRELISQTLLAKINELWLNRKFIMDAQLKKFIDGLVYFELYVNIVELIRVFGDISSCLSLILTGLLVGLCLGFNAFKTYFLLQLIYLIFNKIFMLFLIPLTRSKTKAETKLWSASAKFFEKEKQYHLKNFLTISLDHQDFVRSRITIQENKLKKSSAAHRYLFLFYLQSLILPYFAANMLAYAITTFTWLPYPNIMRSITFVNPYIYTDINYIIMYGQLVSIKVLDVLKQMVKLGTYENENKQVPAFKTFSVKNLTHEIDKRNILKNLNLELAHGDKLMIQGDSGSGKSMLFLILKGLVEPKTAEFKFDNQSCTSDQLRSRVYYVSQNVEFYNLPLRDNLTLTNKNLTDEYILKLLETYDLKRFAKKEALDSFIDIKNISGGEAKRLALVRAECDLLYTPHRMILLDETLANLDKDNKHIAIERIKQWPNSVLMVSHEQDVKDAFPKKYYLTK